MLMKVIFAFLINFKNIKFYIYFELIKVFILKFFNNIKIYNN